MNDKVLPPIEQLKLDSNLLGLLSRIKLLVMDFDGVLTTNSVFVSQGGTESVECSRFDGVGLSAIRKFDIKTAVISAEKNPVVSARCKKLNLDCHQDVSDKISMLNDIVKQAGLSLEQTAYIGNDLYDLPCLNAAAMAIIVNDAHFSVQNLGYYKTNTSGGRGAVREVCDLIVQAKKIL